jgi:6-phosphogluconate dehydrogenase
MHLIFKASITYKYNLQAGQIAKIWRGGCIIRSAFLENIYAAYQKNENLEHLMQDQNIQTELKNSLSQTRDIVTSAIAKGIAIPAYASALAYFDSLRTEHLPSNLIQAQRDYFGAHTYELIGKEGVFHTVWEGKSPVNQT